MVADVSDTQPAQQGASGWKCRLRIPKPSWLRGYLGIQKATVSRDLPSN